MEASTRRHEASCSFAEATGRRCAQRSDDPSASWIDSLAARIDPSESLIDASRQASIPPNHSSMPALRGIDARITSVSRHRARSKLAEQFRQEQAAAIAAMTPRERLDLAFELGRRRIEMYMSAHHVDRETAGCELKRRAALLALHG